MVDEQVWERLRSWAADIRCPICKHAGLKLRLELGGRVSARERPVLYCPNQGCDFEARTRPEAAQRPFP